MDFSGIKQKAESYQAAMTKFLRELVAIPGESCGEKKVIERIASEMKKVGFDKVNIDPMGNVLGYMGTGKTLIAFDAHIDTVGLGELSNWTFDPYKGYETDTEIGGRGASDQRGGIVSAVYGAKIMKDLGLLNDKYTVLVTGTVQEEDCDGLCWQYIHNEDQITPAFVVITEPTDGNIYRGQRGRKVAMSWAYSPSYGKPLSVPQGVIGLMTRLGMNVVLAHPAGYEIMADVEKVALRNAKASGGSFTKTNRMAEAFQDADIVYPKSWAPFKAMEERTTLYGQGDMAGIHALEQRLLAQNKEHQDWQCTEALMKTTKHGQAMYLHCLPADISGVSCATGEVAAAVFDRYREPLYREASYKPYIIAAMILLSKIKNPQAFLLERATHQTQRKHE
jgi:hypothetical protein